MTKNSQKDEVTFEEKFNDYGEYENNTGEDYHISSIDSASNYNQNDYEKDEEETDTVTTIKRLTIALIAIVIIIIIILLLIKACSGSGTKVPVNNDKTDFESKLLQAGKQYFQDMDTELPAAKGTCNIVTLGVLKDLDYLGSEYDECDEQNTYVKVCLLESGTYHYLPVMECNGTDNDTKFGDFEEGTESDVVPNKSDVRFEYKASYLVEQNAKYGKEEEIWKDEIKYDNYKTISVTNYYRYRDKEYTWTLRKRLYYPGDVLNASDEDTYYLKYPANGYTNKTGKTTVYRWYVMSAKTYYPTNDGYAVDQPAGYPYHDDKENVAYVFYQTRDWIEQSKPQSVSPQKMYVCVNPNVSNRTYTSYEDCSLNTSSAYNQGYTKTKEVIYTCDNGLTKVSQNSKCTSCPKGQNLRGDKSSCGYFTEYSTGKINPDYSPVCDVKKDTCNSYTVVVKRWYKANKEYVGNTSPTGEAPYYSTSPKQGAIKDPDTKATGYKWYKLVDQSTTTEYYAEAPQQDAVKTSDFKWGKWSSYSTKKPKAISGSREIQTRAKVKLKQILSSSESSWKDVSSDFISEEELIKKLQDLGYKVNSIEDVALISDIKLQIKVYHSDRI